MIIETLKSIYKRLNNDAVNGVDKERMSFKEQVKYLNRFPDPKDDYERSYYKFKCFCQYCYYKRKWVLVIYNIGAMFLLPFLHIRLRKEREEKKHAEKADAVIENVPRLPNDDIIPDEILKQYRTIKEIKTVNYSDAYLSDAAENIYKKLRKKYFFHFYFRVIVAEKLGQFSAYLDCYQPDAVIFYSCEREFSGPLQSLLCEAYNAEYISFMHGDYLSTLSFAFQRYSVYYVWDESYKAMFESLKCSSPMRIYTPKKMKGIAASTSPDQCLFFATYYFSDETREEALKIYSIFKKFEKNGLRTKIRPHPRFSDIVMLKDVFSDIEIEDTSQWTLRESVTVSLYIVGLNTTVLSQAYFSDKDVVIDDISNSEKYKQLDERGYVMIKRKHILLSQLKNGDYTHFDNQYAFFTG